LPDATGFAERDGVKLYWEVFGSGEQTIALLPTWSIAHSRHWKFQVPYLARHYRVVTFDGRGCGRSDRPDEPAAYSYLEVAADVLAVLDATHTDRAVLAGLSLGVAWGLQLAADRPDRVMGIVCLGPALAFAPLEREVYSFDERLTTTDGWAKYNRHYWLDGGYPDFLEFFFGRFFPEPHSTKQIEDFVGWGLEVDPVTLITSADGVTPAEREPMQSVCGRIKVPVLVIHGDRDELAPHAAGAMLAEITGGQLVTIAGGGHGVQARDPVVVNLLIKRFVDSVVARADQRGARELGAGTAAAICRLDQ
jgi:pimeloyl-ACP methyl ester carboxylesterase